jgi:hypothetical protein
VLDLVTGPLAGDDQGHDGQPRGQGGHEDGRQPLPRSPQDEPGAEALALMAFEVLVVVNQQDTVAGGDAHHGEEPHQ